jgi:hypothetical protein
MANSYSNVGQTFSSVNLDAPIPIDMIDGMKRLSILLLSCGALLSCSLARAADLAGVRTVYILPMRSGLDQFLANRLTNGGVFRVVTDPKLADAVLTDHIGETLEAQLEEMIPDPEPVKKLAPPATAPPPKKDDSPSKSLVGSMVDPDAKQANPARNSTFGRTKGTVFLVDEKSRQVLWSVFDPPKGSESKEMDRTASDIVSRIKKDLAPAK